MNRADADLTNIDRVCLKSRIKELQRENDDLRDLVSWVHAKLSRLPGYTPPGDDRSTRAEVMGWLHCLCWAYTLWQSTVREVDALKDERREAVAENARLRGAVADLTETGHGLRAAVAFYKGAAATHAGHVKELKSRLVELQDEVVGLMEAESTRDAD